MSCRRFEVAMLLLVFIFEFLKKSVYADDRTSKKDCHTLK